MVMVDVVICLKNEEEIHDVFMIQLPITECFNVVDLFIVILGSVRLGWNYYLATIP
jgi:hypothetical protein